jgi:hypothetical protein
MLDWVSKGQLFTLNKHGSPSWVVFVVVGGWCLGFA